MIATNKLASDVGTGEVRWWVGVAPSAQGFSCRDVACDAVASWESGAPFEYNTVRKISKLNEKIVSNRS